MPQPSHHPPSRQNYSASIAACVSTNAFNIAIPFTLPSFVTKCLGLHLLLTCHPAPRPVFRLSYHLVSHTVSQPRPVIQYQLEQEVVPRPSHRPVCRLVCWPLPLLACQPEHQLVPRLSPRRACLLVSLALPLVACRPENQKVPRPHHWPVCGAVSLPSLLLASVSMSTMFRPSYHSMCRYLHLCKRVSLGIDKCLSFNFVQCV